MEPIVTKQFYRPLFDHSFWLTWSLLSFSLIPFSSSQILNSYPSSCLGKDVKKLGRPLLNDEEMQNIPTGTPF